MRDIIRRKLQSGESANSIRGYFVAKYGPWILLAPPASGIGALVWLGPPILILFGVCLLAYLGYQWRRRRSFRIDDEIPSTAEDLKVALARLEDSRDENTVSEAEYRLRQEMLSRKLADIASRPEPRRLDGRGRTWLQFAVMAAMALIIAVSVTLAIQPRGAGPITGSLASSTNPPATPPVPASIPNDVRAAIRTVEASPKSSAAWNSFAAVLLLHREFSQASAAYRNALRLDSQNEAANLGLAFINIGNGKNRRALRELSTVKARDPKSSRLWLLLGLTYSKLPGERRQAILAWSRFLRLSPNNPLTPQVRGWIRALDQGKPAP